MTKMTTTEKIVNSLRSYLRKLAIRRSNHSVTADDAHKYLNGKVPNNPSMRSGLINSAFRGTTEFTASGKTSSQRSAARGRMITQWNLA